MERQNISDCLGSHLGDHVTELIAVALGSRSVCSRTDFRGRD